MYYKGKKVERSHAGGADFHGYGGAIRKELAERIPSRGKLSVLDVGTGFGANATFLARHLSEESRIWTLDPSDEVLARVKAGLSKDDAKRMEFVQASADRLEFEDGFFDAVVSVMVMHHLEKLRESVVELARVLGKGGRLLIVDYTPDAARELEFQSRHEVADFFEPETVKAAAEGAGLKSSVEDFGLWYILEARK